MARVVRTIGLLAGEARRVVSRAEARSIDEIATREFGIPSLVLMENAGRTLAEVVRAVREERAVEGEVVIVCGPGNNGGDGLCASRHLSIEGVPVRVLLTRPPTELRGDSASQWAMLRDTGVKSGIVDPSAGGQGRLVVDAVLGTGLERAPEGSAEAAIGLVRAMRERGAAVVSADLPSGMDADTGRPLGACVRADVTVTFAAAKAGMLTEEGRRACGEVLISGIGVPRTLLERFGRRLEPGEMA